MKWRIVAIFSQVEPVQPFSLLPQNIVSQVAFQPLVYYPYFPICLGVIIGTWCQLGTHQMKNLLSKSTHEATISIIDYGLKKTMKFENISK